MGIIESVQQYDLNIPAGGAQNIDVAGDRVQFLSATDPFAQIEIRPNYAQGNISLKPGQGFRFSEQVTRWVVFNRGSVALTGYLMIGSGDFFDQRISGDVNVIDGGKSRTLSNSAFALVLSPTGSAGNYAMGQLWNPAGSAVRLVVEAMGINSNVANSIAFWGLSNAALTTLVGGGVSKRFSASTTASIAQGRTGGQAAVITDPNRLACQAILQWGWVQQKLAEPIIVEPGYGLVCQNAAAQNQILGVQFEWYEEAA